MINSLMKMKTMVKNEPTRFDVFVRFHFNNVGSYLDTSLLNREEHLVLYRESVEDVLSSVLSLYGDGDLEIDSLEIKVGVHHGD